MSKLEAAVTKRALKDWGRQNGYPYSTIINTPILLASAFQSPAVVKAVRAARELEAAARSGRLQRSGVVSPSDAEQETGLPPQIAQKSVDSSRTRARHSLSFFAAAALAAAAATGRGRR